MEKLRAVVVADRGATCCTFTRTDTTAGFTRSITSAKDGMAIGCCSERSSAWAGSGATKPRLDRAAGDERRDGGRAEPIGF